VGIKRCRPHCGTPLPRMRFLARFFYCACFYGNCFPSPNLKTAKALGLDVPLFLQQRARRGCELLRQDNVGTGQFPPGSHDPGIEQKSAASWFRSSVHEVVNCSLYPHAINCPHCLNVPECRLLTRIAQSGCEGDDIAQACAIIARQLAARCAQCQRLWREHSHWH
jgi:hypothetical protein